ncbi:MAG TPA: AMP-binding protein [Candidatus Coprenecus pullistercoris]|nr:AMP-binding protein [Candidatus Coprenecus pullistercoris]
MKVIMDIEFRSPREIKEFQEELLRRDLEYIAGHSPFYRRMFADNGIDIRGIRCLEDLASLPFTDKNDLSGHNEDFLCCPKDRIADFVTTSGTTGKPVNFCCTDRDLERLAYNEQKSFECAGLRAGDRLQLMVTMDKRFMAGLAYFLGVRKMGVGVIRVGNGIPELQWDSIRELRPDTIMCVPSFILRLIQYAEEHGIDYRSSSIRRIIGIGEALRDHNLQLNLLGRRIQEQWENVHLFSTYSSTEMSATFSECEYGMGGHVHPELIIVEIIGEDGREVPDGEPGEVVITTLGVEGMPLLRFRTGDIAAKFTERCRCGRWSYRLSPLYGRRHNMIKLKGTTLYPPAIKDVLDGTDYVGNFAIIIRSNDTGTDDVLVKAGLCRFPEFDVVKDLKDRFRSRLRVAPEVEILPMDEISGLTLPAKSRKPMTIIDERKNGK